MSDLFNAMKQSILELDEVEAVKLAQQALDQGIAPLDAIEKGFAKGMEEIGEQFDRLDIFLPDVIAAADAMIAAVEVLKSKIEVGAADSTTYGTVVIGTIK